jgi:PST family polysaccharide transporter
MALEAPGGPPVSKAFHPLEAIVTLGGIQALTMLAGLARTKALALMLGPDGVGIASVIDQVVSLVAQLGSLSIPFVALKFLARARDGEASETRRIYDALVMLLAIASVVSAAIGTAIAVIHPTTFGDGLAPYRAVLIVALIGVPPLAIAPLLRNAMAALDRHRESALAAFAGAVLTVAGAIVGMKVAGLIGLYVANAVVLAVTIAGMQWYLGKSLGLRLALDTSRGAIGRAFESRPGVFRFAASMYALALTSPFAYLLARSLLLSRHGAIEAGLVAAAYGIAVSVRLVLNQANGLYLTPLVNRATAKAERTTAVAEYLRILLVIVVSSTMLIVLFPRQWITLLYSTEFAAAVPLVTVFVLGEAVLLLAGVYQALLIGFDDISGFLVSTVTGHVVTIALAALLIGTQGGMGVGIAFLAGNAVILVATSVRLLRAHGARRLAALFLPLTAAMATLAVAGWWSESFGPPAVLRGVAYLAICGVALWSLRPDERRWIMRPLQGLVSARTR